MTGSDDQDALDLLPEKASEAAAALAALKGPAEDAGRAIEASFARAGESLTRSLTRAAADGRVTLDELAEAALRAFAALARNGGGKGVGLAEAFAAAVGSLPSSGAKSGGLGEALGGATAGLFSGARANGGPVVSGGAYLVGERGPEVFRPAAGGSVEPVREGTTVQVRIEASPGSSGILRSEAQIAQALARAATLGARRL